MYPIRSNSMLTLSDDRTIEMQEYCPLYFSHCFSYHHKNCFHLVKFAYVRFRLYAKWCDINNKY